MAKAASRRRQPNRVKHTVGNVRFPGALKHPPCRNKHDKAAFKPGQHRKLGYPKGW
ncbi:hypothetical protein BaRGS_00022617, partial [Batillaria attramentaria]